MLIIANVQKLKVCDLKFEYFLEERNKTVTSAGFAVLCWCAPPTHLPEEWLFYVLPCIKFNTFLYSFISFADNKYQRFQYRSIVRQNGKVIILFYILRAGNLDFASDIKSWNPVKSLCTFMHVTVSLDF